MEPRLLHLSLHAGMLKLGFGEGLVRAMGMHVALSLCVLSMSGQEGISDVTAKASRFPADSGPVWGEGRQPHYPSPLYQLLFLAETEYLIDKRKLTGRRAYFGSQFEGIHYE